MSRSAGDISAIFASTSRSPAARSASCADSAFNSLARSRIAAFSSALNPLLVFVVSAMSVSFVQDRMQ